jgi:hypothetical protein
LKILLNDPVVAAVSEPGEKRWGYYQFPALTRLPDGRILLLFADAEDASETHGLPAPAFVSEDEGGSWKTYHGEVKPTRPHFSISEVFDGEFLSMPALPYFDIEKEGVALPDPISDSHVYGKLYTYMLDDFPQKVKSYFSVIPGRRWTPATGKWQAVEVRYDPANRLAWKRENSSVLPRPFFERPIIKYKDELMYADYRVRFTLDDGRVAPKGGTHLMVSKDNGRSFVRRSTIAIDPDGKDLFGEPTISATADGRLLAVMRRSDHEQKSMAAAWSEDSGFTWTPPRKLFDFGVFPCLHLMDTGALVLSYGRPGVHIAVSQNGGGEKWDILQTIIKGNPKIVSDHTCGYTSLLATGPDSLLLAYSDFDYTLEDGNQHKAITVQRIRFSK